MYNYFATINIVWASKSLIVVEYMAKWKHLVGGSVSQQSRQVWLCHMHVQRKCILPLPLVALVAACTRRNRLQHRLLRRPEQRQTQWQRQGQCSASACKLQQKSSKCHPAVTKQQTQLYRARPSARCEMMKRYLSQNMLAQTSISATRTSVNILYSTR